MDHLERNSAKADEDIRLIRPQLTEAVDGCIAAVGYEWDHYWQKQLLKVRFCTNATNIWSRVLEKHFSNFTTVTNLSKCVAYYVFSTQSEIIELDYLYHTISILPSTL